MSMLDPRTLTVLITGATSGIGAATARRFASAGARVVAVGRRAERLAALTAEFGDLILPLEFDVRDEAATFAAIASLPAPFDAYNVVFANAGLALGLEPTHEADLDDWRTMVETNITGMLYTVRATLPAMVARKQGHLVFTGSVAGDFAYPGANVYGATKAFVKQFSLNVWADLSGSGVRVTNIEPGLTETEFSVVRFAGDQSRAEKIYTGVDAMTGEDIAEQVFFACTQPRHVNINRIQSMAAQQGFAALTVKRNPA
ncbi:SDR family NAD(P)-dependent oxidoreductase [Xanthobacter dioxanivorans]|uniref:SDR family NAD(P)-dependent oxidoreductase n=1 Tax=Xanthobacter dioxanivorans TaxID=2528964 RepID=A0A974PST1_9HYPH|nr:SDR family NAD(P)-dependent oxidoreductase [Xanthobacter dioxanivorans]QRG08734.1 SDR family NAD(P)-dependent oxidoreductase [Xanthobacter dioxanivorans]